MQSVDMGTGYASPALKADGRPTHIYAIHDDTGQSQRVYIGMTIDPAKRLREHVRDAQRGPKTLRNCWIGSLLERGAVPTMTVLEVVPPGGDYQEAERFWIASFRAMGADMANATDGGHGARGYRATPEVRAKISASNTGKKMSPEAIRRRVASRRGWRMPREAAERIAAKNRGRKTSEAERQIHATERRGRPIDGAVSGFKGARLKAGKYDARIDAVYLGRFDTPEAAAVAYDKAARRDWGSAAALNFPFPGEKSARPGVEPQEWIGLPEVELRQTGTPRITNTSGLTGASFCRQNGKWYAAIKVGGKSKNLGYYDTPEEAHAAYKAAKAESDGGRQ